MAYRVRFYMELNAREAMHVIELRTTPQGPAYRRICQAMHRLIAERAGHRANRRGDDLRRPLGRRSSSGSRPSARRRGAAAGA